MLQNYEMRRGKNKLLLYARQMCEFQKKTRRPFQSLTAGISQLQLGVIVVEGGG